MLQKAKFKLWKDIQYITFFSLSIFLFSACETDNLTLEPTLVGPLVNGEVSLDVNEEANVIEPASVTLSVPGVPGAGVAIPDNTDPADPALATPVDNDSRFTFDDLSFSEVNFSTVEVSIVVTNNTSVTFVSGMQLLVKNTSDDSDFISITTDRSILAGRTETFTQNVSPAILKSEISVQALNIRTPGGTSNGNNSLGVTIDFPMLEVAYIDLNPEFTGDFSEITDFEFDLGNEEDLEELTGEVDFTLTNELPLDFTADLIFLDAEGTPILSLDPITIPAGSTDNPQTSTAARIEGSNVDRLRNATQVQADITYTTPAGSIVRLETGSTVKYNLSGKVTPKFKLD